MPEMGELKLCQFYKCGTLFDTDLGLEVVALTSFLFHFPLFSEAFLWASCKILWQCATSPNFVGILVRLHPL